MRAAFARVLQQETLNFLLTNRIPRRLATRFIGWFSKIEQPLVRDLSIALWRSFADVDLSDAKKQNFRSMHDCFTRELRDGARSIDPDPALLVSPCDAIVGACGRIADDMLIQAKGFPYSLDELLGDGELVRLHRDGCYATLRLTAGMYHRFHAPHDCRVTQVTYISGDTWNVNPPALRRVPKLFCKNARAVIRATLDANGHPVTLVPVAAVLVAGIRLHFLDTLLQLDHWGPGVFPCRAWLAKGQEMGWFEQGSTVIVFAPRGFELCGNVTEGARVRVGQPLMRLP
jgi:phosphatidylserine decarboxylase